MKKISLSFSVLFTGLFLFSAPAVYAGHHGHNPCDMKEMKHHNPCDMKEMKHHNPCDMKEMKHHNPCSMEDHEGKEEKHEHHDD